MLTRKEQQAYELINTDKLTEHLAGLAQKVAQNRSEIQSLRRMFFSLLGLCAKNKLDAETFVSYVQTAKQQFPRSEYSESRDEFAYSLLECVWIQKAQIAKENTTEQTNFRDKVKPVLKQLIEKGVVKAEDIYLVLEADLAIPQGLSNMTEESWKLFSSQTYTQRHLTVIKFNLLREENEGFAKLIVELTQLNINSQNLELVSQNIQRLIGYFSLCPYRALDLLLTAFEHRHSNLAYLALLQKFGSQHSITQILGFKLKHTPSLSLVRLTALLLREGLVAIEEIWPHISPDAAKDPLSALLDSQFKSLDYNYQMLFKAIMQESSFEPEFKLKHAEQESINTQRRQAVDLLPVKLMQACVEVNNWETMDDICSGIYDNKFDFTLSPPLIQAICDSLHWLIEPLYLNTQPVARSRLQDRLKNLRPRKQLLMKQAATIDELFETLPKILRIFGIYIAYDEILFQKLLKVLQTAQKPEHVQQVWSLCGEIFLPALSISSVNLQLGTLVWLLYKKCPYQQRYAHYSTILQKTYLSTPQTIAVLILTQRNQLQWSRRLNVDTLKQLSKGLKKLSFNNGLVAFHQITTVAKNYENNHEAQLEAMKSCTELSLDMAAFSCLCKLADLEGSHFDSEGNYSKTLTNLAEFMGAFFNRIPATDIQPTLSYIVNASRDHNQFPLSYVVHLILRTMSGWQDFVVDQLKAQQLDQLAAGYALLCEGRQESLNKNVKALEALLTLFWNSEEQIGFRLMGQLAASAQWVARRFECEDLTLVSRQFDKTKVYFSHLVDTLHYLSSSEPTDQAHKFALLLPEHAALRFSTQFKLPPPYIFKIMRSSLPQIYKQTPQQFETTVSTFWQVLQSHFEQRISAATTDESAVDAGKYWSEKRLQEVKLDEINKHMSPQLYCIFWYLQLSNLYAPVAHYKEEVRRLTDEVRRLSEELKDPKNKKKKDELKEECDRITRLQKAMQVEQEQMINQQELTLKHLSVLLPQVFAAMSEFEPKVVADNFVQVCMFPRIILSAKDALFTFHFFKLLASLEIPNFQLLYMLSSILKYIVPVMHCCSETEAESLGIFFAEIFKLLEHWSKRVNWRKECATNLSFARKFKSDECISFEEFTEKIVQNCGKLFSTQLMSFLDKSEPMLFKARCCLIILNRVANVMPTTFVSTIQKKLQTLVDAKATIKQDLWTLASGVNENLKKKMPQSNEERKEVLKTKTEESKAREVSSQPDSKNVQAEAQTIGPKRTVAQTSFNTNDHEVKEPPMKRQRVEKSPEQTSHQPRRNSPHSREQRHQNENHRGNDNRDNRGYQPASRHQHEGGSSRQNRDNYGGSRMDNRDVRGNERDNNPRGGQSDRRRNDDRMNKR